MADSAKHKGEIQYSTTLCRKKEQIFSEVENEVILLSIENGEYINLNEVGSYIWRLLENEITFEQLIVYLLNKFTISRKECEEETLPFLEELIENQVIHIIND